MTFVPSHADVIAPVSAPGAEPSRWMLVLHGILGSGSTSIQRDGSTPGAVTSAWVGRKVMPR